MKKEKKPAEKKANLFLLTGENSFELKKFLKNWEKAARVKYGDFAVSRIDFLETEFQNLLAELETPPFFGSEKRVFFLENFPPPPPSRPFSAEKKGVIEKTAEVLARISEDTVVICAVEKPDRRISAWKKLEKVFGKIQIFPAFEKGGSGMLSPKGKMEATDFVLKTVAEKEGKILPAAAAFLVDFCGGDPWKLNSEIEKLILFSRVREKPISEDDIQKSAIPSDEMAGFAFSNAIQSENIAEILGVIQKLIDTGEAPQAILARDAAPVIRQLLAVKTAKDASEAGIHPFVFGKMKSVARKIPLEKLQKAHSDLLKIDIDSKTGNLPITPEKTDLFQLALERIFLELFA